MDAHTDHAAAHAAYRVVASHLPIRSGGMEYHCRGLTGLGRYCGSCSLCDHFYGIIVVYHKKAGSGMTKPSSVIDRKIRGSLMFSFVWLIYLIIPINALLHKSASEMWIGFSVLVLFVLIYLLSYLDSSRRLLCVMGLFVIIGFFACIMIRALYLWDFIRSPSLACFPPINSL